MSGGYFNYSQYHIGNIAEEIEQLVRNNIDLTRDQYGDTIGNNYSDKTIHEFIVAINLLRVAQVYAQRIDWLLSDDDGEDTFHIRLKSDLSKLVQPNETEDY